MTSIKNESGDYIERADAILKKYNFIQLVYEVDKEFTQVRPVICRRNSKAGSLKCDKSHCFTKLMLDEQGFYIPNPYIHYRTGKASITVTLGIAVFDLAKQIMEHDCHRALYRDFDGGFQDHT